MITSSNGNIFRVNDHLCGEFTDHWWIPLTKSSDTELWCFLWSVTEQTFEQTIKALVIWDAIMLITTSLLCTVLSPCFYHGDHLGTQSTLISLPRLKMGDSCCRSGGNLICPFELLVNTIITIMLNECPCSLQQNWGRTAGRRPETYYLGHKEGLQWKLLYALFFSLHLHLQPEGAMLPLRLLHLQRLCQLQREREEILL